MTAAAANAKSDIWSALLDPKATGIHVSINLEAINSAELPVTLLEATVMMALMPALGVNTSTQPDNGKSYIINSPNVQGRFKCPGLPNETFNLTEYCCYNPDANNTILSADKCPVLLTGCPNPYKAYTNWCDPLVCTKVRPKPLHVYLMQVAAAIGGMYSLITLVFVSLIWSLVVAVYRRSMQRDVRAQQDQVRPLNHALQPAAACLNHALQPAAACHDKRTYARKLPRAAAPKGTC